MKILLKVPLNPYSGYGNDGIGMTMALLNMGLDVSLQPTHVTPPLPAPVAALLSRRLEGPFDLLIHHVDPAQLGLDAPVRRAAETAVAWTMWEYSTLDNLRTRPGIKQRLVNYDAVFGYDTITAGALEPHTGGKKGPQLGVVQGGFWPQEWPEVARDWHSPRFGFCMEGALHERKDPFVAIQAFAELKQDHPDEFALAELHLKTNITGLHPAMEEAIDRLRVHYSVWPQEILHQFYGAQHVLLAPSRGEGKNMPALQFLSTGGTVIATNWGGHTQWLSPSYAYPLDYELRAVSPKTPNCLQARADKDHLKALMLHVFRNRDEAQRKGALAAQTIPGMCSWPTVMDRFFDRLADLVPGRGERLLATVRAAQAQTADRRRPALALP